MEKKRSLAFWLTAFGVPVILGILMGIVFYMGKTTGSFPIVWMFLPASGVMLGQLITKKEDDGTPRLPKKFIYTFLATTALEVVTCLLTFFMDGDTTALIGNFVFMAGSILSLIFLFTEKKEVRKAYGLSMPKLGKGVLIVLLFIFLWLVLGLGPTIVASLIEGTAITAETLGITFVGVVTMVSLPITLFIAFIPYFGEEYGWRYFLMPRLTKKFGGRLGVIILGVIWGLWHLPINMFFYSPDTALQSIVLQVIACICFAIFFAWAYYKTDCNIWVVTAIHFFNNNLGACFTEGGDGSNQTYTWEMVGIMALLYIALVALPFIFSKVFSKKGVPSFEKEATVALASEQEAIETV